MSISKPKLNRFALSICIPVFNDQQELAKTLASLRELDSSGVGKSGPTVEVLISDNASTDGSGKLIDSFALANIPVNKFRQRENLGFRGNIEFLAAKSLGDWTLFVSCGDELVSNFSFSKAFAALAETNCDTAFFEFEMLDVVTGKTYTDKSPHSTFALEQSDTIYSAAPMPFFRTSKLKSTILTQQPISGDWWPQIEWALEASRIAGTAAYLTPGPITGNRPAAGWWSKPLAYKSVIELAKLLESQAADHKARARLLEDAKDTWKTLPSWVFQTKVVFANRPTAGDRKLILGQFRHAPLVVLLAFGILTCPTPFLNLVRSISRGLEE